MSQADLEDRRTASSNLRSQSAIQLQELGRRNRSALAMDALYLITTSFFTVLATKAWDSFAIRLPFTSIIVGPIPYSWPMLISLIPLGTLLIFGWRSSKAFFLSQVAVIVATLLVIAAGYSPL